MTCTSRRMLWRDITIGASGGQGLRPWTRALRDELRDHTSRPTPAHPTRPTREPQSPPRHKRPCPRSRWSCRCGGAVPAAGYACATG